MNNDSLKVVFEGNPFTVMELFSLLKDNNIRAIKSEDLSGEINPNQVGQLAVLELDEKKAIGLIDDYLKARNGIETNVNNAEEKSDNAENNVAGIGKNLTKNIITELKNIKKSGSKLNSLTLLVITIIIFFSTGIVSSTPLDIALLIIVLLFHEIGHFIAMKVMKYNDVKMFFIPLLGAAVSGKNKNETAVKSCIVSLLGPFPGILIGVLLYFIFGLTKNYYIYKTAQIMLILNAFNFLPIMPLDGGRYVDVLFINSRYFRFVFSLIGAIVFVVLAIVDKSIVLGIVGAFSVIGAFTNFRIHGIAKSLKTEDIKASSVDELLDDEDSMQIILKKLKDAFPKSFSPEISYKKINDNLEDLINTIKFIPAKLLSKFIFLSFYFVMLLVSIVVSFFFLAMDYKEIIRKDNVDGKRIIYNEQYYFGAKSGECPINDNLFYDGKGIGFNPDLTISDIFYYSNGYRTGEWPTFDPKGNVIMKEQYENGKLISVSSFENDNWETKTFEELSILRRVKEKIRECSQPVKSNHKYFLE